jgi:hypothetical protein
MLCLAQSVEAEMRSNLTQGRYRTEPVGDHTPMAYVIDGGTATYVTEAVYRAKGYNPEFDELPTEQEYDA